MTADHEARHAAEHTARKAAIADAIRADLLSRDALAFPHLAEAVAVTAALAAELAIFSGMLKALGANERDAACHARSARTLSTGLVLLDTRHVAGTVAEGILRDAVLVDAALLELMEPSGQA